MRLLSYLAVLLALLMSALAIWQINKSPDVIEEVVATPIAPTPLPEAVEVPIRPGQGPKEIGETLEDLGIIDSAIQFRVLVALLGYDRLLQAGDYEFDVGTPALDVVYRMRRGVVSSRFVTVVEGWRLEQIADALEEKGIPRQDFLIAARAGEYEFDFLQGLDPDQTVEGYLFPATYYFRRSDSARDIVRRMLEAFDENVPAGLRQEALQAGLSLHDVLTIASIVEREAQVAEERPIIAQVFLKRLRLGMPLDADPTVQYAVAAEPGSPETYGYWKQQLTLADLEVDSPHNTYRVVGLPPGPIANPGLDSIVAVIRPAKTNYLYFVAKPDGSHAFAKTLEEHLENVRKYQSQ